jgi:hypothetical protein
VCVELLLCLGYTVCGDVGIMYVVYMHIVGWVGGFGHLCVGHYSPPERFLILIPVRG